MEIGNQAKFKTQESKILAKTALEPGRDLADGDRRQEYFIVHDEKPGFACLDGPSAKPDGYLLLDVIRIRD